MLDGEIPFDYAALVLYCADICLHRMSQSYEPMRDKQRCVAEADKSRYQYAKVKAVEENQRLKMAKEQATQKSLM
ncbi:hypothetical protein L5M43_04755 [Shewanella sp. SW36]|uniref:hypothetical protein n=1 Tax=Shewanella TaxID=22 RepID=UPI001FFCBDE1|nr:MULTISPECIES: hypothetical protein [Shewanella]MCU7974584.1 hypothetical protein [Shewanella sp. SW36]MCU7989972.1 hypothetical protein [Shewanella sp. SW1]MCU8017354.1 hypothetical protein [Shewanella sp. SM72]MCU8051369.1 hypothetical protein [Shewanella sp. SM43]